MQTNFPDATANERRLIRTWRIRVAAFYASLCVVLLLLSLLGDRGGPTIAGAPSSTSLEAFATR